MKRIAIKPIAIKHFALFAALVVSSAAHDASYDYTAHYSYMHKSALNSAQTAAQLQVDTATCDSTVGGAEVCDPPPGTVHYFDPDQNLPCTRTGARSVCSYM